ncbi:glucan endo-1,3-beta-glucosidase 11-like [Rhodamnia argentea]|uniref:glucan endo-1,3-beta-D-glucosidase n=1 Tax=Rhodamnia argentea TaxID=178133 RepID=A0ABM3GSE5_9MYRT|nr:glucan endo-1,3-beta-glucosidase 11-like [Rhodamnia argentea]
MANMYPYISYLSEARHVSSDYGLFRGGGEPVNDGTLAYDNMIDASVDAFVWVMEKEGFRGVAVLVAETGWPTVEVRLRARRRTGIQRECGEVGGMGRGDAEGLRMRRSAKRVRTRLFPRTRLAYEMSNFEWGDLSQIGCGDLGRELCVFMPEGEGKKGWWWCWDTVLESRDALSILDTLGTIAYSA